MPVVHRSLLAEQDYREIWRYIAADNPDAADRFLRLIDVKLNLYAGHPQMGTECENLAPNLRSFPVGTYLAFYRIVTGGIELVRVLHGARNFRAIFRTHEQS